MPKKTDPAVWPKASDAASRFCKTGLASAWRNEFQKAAKSSSPMKVDYQSNFNRVGLAGAWR